MNTARSSRSLTFAIALVLMLIPSAWLAWSYRDMPQLGLHHDDAIYYVSAKSLTDSQGYRISSLPGEPAQTKYPPAYPALLSLAWKIDPEFPRNLPWAALLTWLPLPFWLLVTNRMFREYGFGATASLAMCAFVAVNPMTLTLSVSAMSEIPFSILFAGSALAGESGTAWAGFIGALAYLARSAAMPLIVTTPCLFAFRRQFRRAIVYLLAMGIPVALWSIWVRTHQVPGNDFVTLYYTNYLGFRERTLASVSLPSIMWANLDSYLLGIGQLLTFNVEDTFFAQQMQRVVALGALIGSFRLVRRTGKFHFAAAAALMSAMLIIWHFPPNLRFVYPMFPLLLAGLVVEISHVWEMVAFNWRKPLAADKTAAVVVASLVCSFIVGTAWSIYRGAISVIPGILAQRREISRRDAAIYSWIRSNTPTSARFMAYDDAVLYLYTGRKAIEMPVDVTGAYKGNAVMAQQVEEVPQYFDEYGIDYLVVTDTDYARDRAEARLPTWRRVVATSSRLEKQFETNGAVVYRVRRQSASNRNVQ